MTRIQSRKLLRAWKRFTEEMYQELAAREAEGWDGWDDKNVCTEAALIRRAKENLRRFGSDPDCQDDGIHAAELILFVWNRRRFGGGK